MQTKNGGDPASVRVDKQTEISFNMKIAEEQALNAETNHVGESVGYISLGSTSSTETSNMKKLTFSWDYIGDALSIVGFRIYLNNIVICETTDNTATQLECTVNLSIGSNLFTIKAIDLSGNETNASNMITYQQ
jgi:hypothetical protein